MLNKELLLLDIFSKTVTVTVTLEALNNKYGLVRVYSEYLNYEHKFASNEKITLSNVPKGTQFELSTDKGDVSFSVERGFDIIQNRYPTVLEVNGDTDAYVTFRSY